MITDAMTRMAQTAGFALEGDPALQSKLAPVALLIQQERTSKLMAMFHEFGQSEFRAYAQVRGGAGHGAVADMLLAHADGFVVSAGSLTWHPLRQSSHDT